MEPAGLASDACPEETGAFDYNNFLFSCLPIVLGRDIDREDREHHHAESASRTDKIRPVGVIAMMFEPTVVTSMKAHQRASL